MVDGADLTEKPFDFLIAELGAEIRAPHLVLALVGGPGSLEAPVPDKLGDTQRATGVPGRWLDPEAFEGAFA